MAPKQNRLAPFQETEWRVGLFMLALSGYSSVVWVVDSGGFVLHHYKCLKMSIISPFSSSVERITSTN